MDELEIKVGNVSGISTDELKSLRIQLYSIKLKSMVEKKDINKELLRLLDIYSILLEGENTKVLEQQIENNMREREEIGTKKTKLEKNNRKITRVLNKIDNELCIREYV